MGAGTTTTREILGLALLATLFEKPSTEAETVDAVRALCLPWLTPTREVVAGVLSEYRDAGYLHAESRRSPSTSPSSGSRLEVTPPGEQELRRLVLDRTGQPAHSLVILCESLRLSIADRLDPPARGEVLRAQIRARRRCLATQQRRLVGSGADDPTLAHTLRHQIACAQAECDALARAARADAAESLALDHSHCRRIACAQAELDTPTVGSREEDRDAFSLPSSNMPFEARAQFAIGNGLFRRPWVSSPSSTRSADGLGPLYNARSCQRCHLKDGRGHPPANAEDSAVSMLIRLSVPPRTEEEHALLASGRVAVIPEPTYGGQQLQDVAVPGMAAEGRIRVTPTERETTFDDGAKAALEVPRYAIVDTGYGPLDPNVMTSPRVAPPMIGLGLLEAVAASDILARADPVGDPEMNMSRPYDSRPDAALQRRGPSAPVPASGVSLHAGVRRIPSAELFVSGAVVEIEHGGEIYRLRHTRRGKLILTK